MKSTPSLLLLENEKIFTDTLVLLRQNEKWNKPIIMERMDDGLVFENVEENIQYCILMGKDEKVITKPPLKSLHGPECMSLASIVDQITFPRAKLVIFSDGRLVRVDRSENCLSVEYKLSGDLVNSFAKEFKAYPRLSVSKTAVELHISSTNPNCSEESSGVDTVKDPDEQVIGEIITSKEELTVHINPEEGGIHSNE